MTDSILISEIVQNGENEAVCNFLVAPVLFTHQPCLLALLLPGGADVWSGEILHF